MKNHKTGLTKKKTSWDDDINQYVTIETTTARYGGKFIRYDDNFGYLCPSVSDDCDLEKGTIKSMEVERATKFSLRDVVVIRPTTRKKLENYIEFHNKVDAKIERLRKEKELRKLQNQPAKSQS